MVVSTVYDNDLKAKVFQVRDSERYTNSTQTSLEIEYTNTRSDYVTINFTASVKSALGNSSIGFFCDDELLGFVNYKQGDMEATFSTHVAYGYHKYYAKYMGNVQCLSSKSPITELEITEPNLTKTKFVASVTGVDDNNWASNISNVEFNISLKTVDDTNLHEKTVTVTLDDTTTTDITTVNGNVNLTGSSILNSSLWTNGEHTLKFEYDDGIEYIGCETELTISIGYIVSLTRRYAKLVIGDTGVFDVGVTKPDGTPVEGVTVSLKRGS